MSNLITSPTNVLNSSNTVFSYSFSGYTVVAFTPEPCFDSYFSIYEAAEGALQKAMVWAARAEDAYGKMDIAQYKYCQEESTQTFENYKMLSQEAERVRELQPTLSDYQRCSSQVQKAYEYFRTWSEKAEEIAKIRGNLDDYATCLTRAEHEYQNYLVWSKLAENARNLLSQAPVQTTEGATVQTFTFALTESITDPSKESLLDPRFSIRFDSPETFQRAREVYAKKALRYSNAVTILDQDRMALEHCWKSFELRLNQEMSPEECANFQKENATCIAAAKNPSNDQGYELREVAGAGFGVFAKKSYESSQVVGLFAGVLTQTLIDEEYAFSFGSDDFKEFSIDASDQGNCMRFLNHNSASKANVICYEIFDFETRTPYIVVITKKEIQEGEQFTCDYGSSYWEGKAAPIPL